MIVLFPAGAVEPKLDNTLPLGFVPTRSAIFQLVQYQACPRPRLLFPGTTIPRFKQYGPLPLQSLAFMSNSTGGGCVRSL